MLQTLHIKNFALIEQLHIDFDKGFSTITGETGAGKSILLGALGLVLGNRADLSSLKDKEQKCVVEGYFAIADYGLTNFFTDNDLDYEDTTILRREILPSGKSRAFINDSPVNLQVLQELGAYLIDIHSQQQTRELSDEAYQMQILDAIAGNSELLEQYKKELTVLKSLRRELKQLEDEKEALHKERDYNTFLLQELLAANLKEGEQEVLESELEKLGNVEFIKESLAKVLAVTGEEQVGALQNLKEIKIALQKIAPFSKAYDELHVRLNSIAIELDDIVSEVSVHYEGLADDPEELEKVSQKLQNIYTLQKKHQVATVEELITIREALDAKVVLAEGLDGTIKKLTEAISNAGAAVDAVAVKLHQRRQAAVPKFTNGVTALLAQLGMPNARFNFEVKSTESYNNNGKDAISLLFSANKGTDFGLLKKVASGGEMSRIMLAVKAILAGYSKLPAIIFDEIDTGVSGEIANKMGDIMKVMGQDMQVMAITHLPQIAAKGAAQYKVLKITQQNTTVSQLKQLSNEERVREIAEMLSGKDITESALTHAKALLN